MNKVSLNSLLYDCKGWLGIRNVVANATSVRQLKLSKPHNKQISGAIANLAGVYDRNIKTLR